MDPQMVIDAEDERSKAIERSQNPLDGAQPHQGDSGVDSTRRASIWTGTPGPSGSRD